MKNTNATCTASAHPTEMQDASDRHTHVFSSCYIVWNSFWVVLRRFGFTWTVVERLRSKRHHQWPHRPTEKTMVIPTSWRTMAKSQDKGFTPKQEQKRGGLGGSFCSNPTIDQAQLQGKYKVHASHVKNSCKILVQWNRFFHSQFFHKYKTHIYIYTHIQTYTYTVTYMCTTMCATRHHSKQSTSHPGFVVCTIRQ